jgi:hypothetical protein
MAFMIAGLALAVGIAAQAPPPAPDATPWMPFLGCWGSEAESRRNPITCVLSVEGDPLAADLVELRNGMEVRRSRVRADGTVSAIESAECEGRESARFSLDATRVYLHGEVACDGASVTRSVSLLAITPEARLLHVSGRDAVDEPNVAFRALRGIPWSRLPKVVRRDLEHLEAAVFAQRTAMSRVALSSAAVVETSRSMGAPVSEIWLAAVVADSPMWTPLDASAREELVTAGVPARVIDLLAALEYPNESSVELSAKGARVVTRDQLADQFALQRTVLRLAQAMAGAGGASPGRSDGALPAPASVCSSLAGVFFGGGGFGAAASVSAQGARQLLLHGCRNFVVGDPRVFDVAFGIYPGSMADHAAAAAPSTAPMGHPAPEPIPLGGLGGNTGGSSSSPGSRQPAPAPPSRGGGMAPSSAPSGHAAPAPIPLGGLGTPAPVRTP